MSKSDPTALMAAAAAFDAELATYTRLGDLFLRAPLNTLKQLERANEVLQDIAKSEGRLSECGQKLVQALSGARTRQEEMSRQVIEHAPALGARNAQLQELMAELQALAQDVAAMNQAMLEAKANAIVPDVSAQILEFSKRAEDLAAKSREANMSELGEQAHALYQRLQALAVKLREATGKN